MRVLFDECVPRPLRRHLPGHSIKTVQEMGWGGITNGNLLALAEGEFDVLLTLDSRVSCQQNLAGRSIGVVLIATKDRRISRLIQLAPEIESALQRVRAGEWLKVTGDSGS